MQQIGAEYLATSEVARRLNISAQRVRQLEQAGRLRAIWTTLGRLYEAEDVDRLAKERRARKAAAA